MPKTLTRPLPRYWKTTIHRLTGLNFCDRSCGCGDNNQLWWFPVHSRDSLPDWLPGNLNGIDTESLWRWLVRNGHDKPEVNADASA